NRRAWIQTTSPDDRTVRGRARAASPTNNAEDFGESAPPTGTGRRSKQLLSRQFPAPGTFIPEPPEQDVSYRVFRNLRGMLWPRRFRESLTIGGYYSTLPHLFLFPSELHGSAILSPTQSYRARVLLTAVALALALSCVWPHNHQPEQSTSSVMAPADLETAREVLARHKQEILLKYKAVGV